MIWENRVQLKLNEYANCMLNVWNEVNTLHVNADVEVNELLHIMLRTFQISKVKLKKPAKITM
ncbi:hypothetical protein DI291_10755 [Bacillus paralicheniformis]|nr:hypothetical protein DI291_10755 [Bacillus paralicheniformis]